MTTIACNKTEMCSDLQFTLNGNMKTKGKTKIYKIAPHILHYPDEEFIVGFCGNASDIIDVADYYYCPENYKQIPRVRNLSGLILTKSGKIYHFDTPGKWLIIDAPFAAMGSGSPVALGALHTGATPKEAVLAASKVDTYTGMGTKVLSF